MFLFFVRAFAQASDLRNQAKQARTQASTGTAKLRTAEARKRYQSHRREVLKG